MIPHVPKSGECCEADGVRLISPQGAGKQCRLRMKPHGHEGEEHSDCSLSPLERHAHVSRSTLSLPLRQPPARKNRGGRKSNHAAENLLRAASVRPSVLTAEGKSQEDG